MIGIIGRFFFDCGYHYLYEGIHKGFYLCGQALVSDDEICCLCLVGEHCNEGVIDTVFDEQRGGHLDIFRGILCMEYDSL